MMHELPMSGGDEYDAFSGWRRVLTWRAGDRKKIKRRYNRRVRRVATHGLEDYDWPTEAEMRLLEFELNGCVNVIDQPFN